MPPDEVDNLARDDEALTDAQFAELERRRANLEANPTSGRQWEDVYARLKARCGG